MARKAEKVASEEPVVETPKAPKIVGATSGVMAPGPAGKAARKLAHDLYGGGTRPS